MSPKIIFCFVVFCAVFGSLRAFGVNEDPLCGDVCPDTYEPVCGTDGRYYQEFANDCQLRAHNCNVERSLMRTYAPVHIDMCRTQLINGLDKLMTKMGNLNLNKPECMRPCNKMYDPTCISNGKYRTLVDNPCFMDIVNCVVGKKDFFKMIARGTC